MKIQQYIEDLQKKYHAKKAGVDTMTNNINQLINHLRNIEEQIQMNAKQSVHDYERLILDCQVERGGNTIGIMKKCVSFAENHQ